jgi:hypothetical protein
MLNNFLILASVCSSFSELISKLLSLVGPLLGVLLGWSLANRTYTKRRSKRHFDLFERAILDELRKASEISEQYDQTGPNFLRDSIPRLEFITIYLKNKHQKDWEKIEPIWLQYSQIETQRIGRAEINPEGEYIARDLIIEKLSNLLTSVVRISQ